MLSVFFLYIHFNLYSTILFSGGVISLFIAIAFYQFKGEAVRSFGIVTFLIALWGIGYSFELSCERLDEMMLWVDIEYLSVALLPAFGLLFVFRFTGKTEWIQPKRLLLIFFIPVVTLLLTWTNSFHHLQYISTSVDNSGPFPMLNIKTGIWYKIHAAYFYLTLAIACFLLLKKMKEGDRFYKMQNKMIFAGLVFPWAGNILYLLDFRPYHHLDLTPFSFILSSFFFTIALFKFQLFDIIPVARENIINKMQEGMMVLDEHEQIINMNPAMKAVFTNTCIERKNKGILGKYFYNIFPGNIELKEIIAKRMNDKVEITFELNGVVKSFAVTVTPLSKKNDLHQGTLLLFRDVTERKKSEEKVKQQAVELKELNDLKDKLFSVISHDLRGPLSNLVSYFNLIEQGIISEDELRASIPELNKNINKVALLVDNLLLWSKSQLKGEVVKFEEINLSDLTDSIIAIYHTTSTEKDIHVQKRIPLNTFVYADRDMLQVILRNLLSNAIKFTKPSGTIDINAESKSNSIVMSIHDNGIGMNKTTLDKLFNKGFTTVGTSNEKGTGLGLQLTKDFIEKNNGDIWVESEPGKGTTFYFSLPKKHSTVLPQVLEEAVLR